MKSFSGIEQLNMNNQLIFIHIPKTGGTSIGKALGFKSTSHIKAKEVTHSAPLIKGKFSFAVVRNPYERFISLYNYARQEVSTYHNNIEPHKALYGIHLDYELLKKSSIEECANYLLEGKLKHDSSWNHWKPQYSWVYYKDKLLVDNIYHLNNLHHLKDDLRRKFNIQIQIPYLNSSESNRQNYLLNQRTKRIIEEYYSKDFQLFNF